MRPSIFRSEEPDKNDKDDSSSGRKVPKGFEKFLKKTNKGSNHEEKTSQDDKKEEKTEQSDEKKVEDEGEQSE